MEWKSSSQKLAEAQAKKGRVRLVRRFLLFPKSLGNQTKWLERATIQQQYDCFSGWEGWTYGWFDEKFVD